MTGALWRRVESCLFPLVLLVVAWWVMLAGRLGVGVASIFPVLDGFSLLGLVALGIGTTLLLGQLDLSAVGVVTLGGIVAVHLQGLGLFPALVLTSAIGATYGMLQGYLIRRLAIDSVVFTVSVSILLSGVASVIAPVAKLLRDPTMGDPLLTRYGVFSVGSILTLAIFAAVGIFLNYTRVGREMYAVGGNLVDARNAGVGVTRTFLVAFGISGGSAALAGAIAAYQGGSANSTSYTALLLTAVSAAVIGGISLRGGRGGVANIALGVGILGCISAGIAARGKPDYVDQIITAALLGLVIAGEYLLGRINLTWRRHNERRAVSAVGNLERSEYEV